MIRARSRAAAGPDPGAAARRASSTARCWRISSWPSGTRIAAGLSPEEARRAARRSFGSIERDEGRRTAISRSVRWIDTLREGRPLRAAAAAARSAALRRRHRRHGDRHRRQRRDVQPRGRRAAEAAALSGAGSHRPRLGGADARRRATGSRTLNLRRLEAAEHVVRGAVGHARAERRADRRRRAVAAGRHAGVGRLLRGLRREGRASAARSSPRRGSAGRGAGRRR